MSNDNDKIEVKTLSKTMLEKRKKQILDLFPPIDNVIRGSLISRNIKCGKKNCKCKNGDGHLSIYLSSFFKGNRRMDHIPKSLAPEIQSNIDNYKLIQDLISELAEINLELFRRREGKKGRKGT
jgi:hypothetical protein